MSKDGVSVPMWRPEAQHYVFGVVMLRETPKHEFRLSACLHFEEIREKGEKVWRMTQHGMGYCQ